MRSRPSIRNFTPHGVGVSCVCGNLQRVVVLRNVLVHARVYVGESLHFYVVFFFVGGWLSEAFDCLVDVSLQLMWLL